MPQLQTRPGQRVSDDAPTRTLPNGSYVLTTTGFAGRDESAPPRREQQSPSSVLAIRHDDGNDAEDNPYEHREEPSRSEPHRREYRDASSLPARYVADRRSRRSRMLSAKFQSSTYRRLQWMMTVIIVAGIVSVLVQGLGDPGPYADEALAFLMLAAAGLAVMLRRFHRVAAYAYDDHLRIVNPLRTWVVPWSSVASVQFVQRGGRTDAAVITTEGRTIHIVGLAVPIWRADAPERSDAGAQLRSLTELTPQGRTPQCGSRSGHRQRD